MSAIGQIWGAKKAADASKDAAKYTADTQMKMFQQIRSDNEPYRLGGYGAYGQLQALLGLGGDPAKAQQAFQGYQDSTGYQFRLGEGIQAIDRSAAARGGLNSGATMKALERYGQNLASSEFNNYLNQLQGVIAPGQQALTTNASAGQNAANAIGNSAMAAGAARASAYGAMGSGAKSVFEDIGAFGAKKGWWG